MKNDIENNLREVKKNVEYLENNLELLTLDEIIKIYNKTMENYNRFNIKITNKPKIIKKLKQLTNGNYRLVDFNM